MKIAKGFSLEIWNSYYNRIKDLGTCLKESRGIEFALCEEDRREIESEIKYLSEECSIYLNSLGMKIPRPLWIYSDTDKSTWPSSIQFKYPHLLKFGQGRKHGRTMERAVF